MLDIDNSGELSVIEVKMLLEALDIVVTDEKFSQLIASADLNGNGTIEFDEYCWMVMKADVMVHFPIINKFSVIPDVRNSAQGQKSTVG